VVIFSRVAGGGRSAGSEDTPRPASHAKGEQVIRSWQQLAVAAPAVRFAGAARLRLRVVTVAGRARQGRERRVEVDFAVRVRVNALFRYAGRDGFISIRSFFETDRKSRFGCGRGPARSCGAPLRIPDHMKAAGPVVPPSSDRYAAISILAL